MSSAATVNPELTATTRKRSILEPAKPFNINPQLFVDSTRPEVQYISDYYKQHGGTRVSLTGMMNPHLGRGVSLQYYISVVVVAVLYAMLIMVTLSFGPPTIPVYGSLRNEMKLCTRSPSSCHVFHAKSSVSI